SGPLTEPPPSWGLAPRVRRSAHDSAGAAAQSTGYQREHEGEDAYEYETDRAAFGSESRGIHRGVPQQEPAGGLQERGAVLAGALDTGMAQGALRHPGGHGRDRREVPPRKEEEAD